MIYVKKIPPTDWHGLSRDAHLTCFSELREPAKEKIDFALLCVNELGRPMGYVTCREWDENTIYWAYGGSFPGTQGTVNSWACYEAMTRYCKERFDRIVTLIENDNKTMLKFAAKIGYKIIGIRNVKNSILLEHVLELRS